MACVSVTLLVVGACGSDDGGDADPTTTADDGTTTSDPAASTSTTMDDTGGSSDGIPVRAYFARDEKVGPVLRTADEPTTVARDALSGLLDGPMPDEDGWGFSTAIPDGTELLDVGISDGFATVDLSEEFESGGGSLSMSLRVAQVVFTLTQFPTVDRVSFEIDGTPVEAIGGEGVVVDPPVGRDDFQNVTPAILVESPLPGETVTSPLTVAGSSATFEGTVQISVTDGDGATAYESFFTSTGANGVWGPFEETIEFEGTYGSGTVTLWEGDASSDDPAARRNEVDVPVDIR